MRKNDRRFTAIRRSMSAVENDLLEDLMEARIDRREFLRHGSVLGLSLPLLGGLAGAIGVMGVAQPARAAGKPGGTLRLALTVPAGAIDPITIADNGGLQLLLQVGEFLCVEQQDLTLKPVLAESWKPNADGTVWTFKLRKGVTFQDGSALNADDVVVSVDRLCDPKNASNALSAFKGILSPGGSKKVDDLTVEFHLDQASGNFPYVLSSDNYNMVILPASYKEGYEKNWLGTGPWKLEKYTPKVGASFVRNDNYWGTKALLDRTEFTFFDDLQPQILALQGGQVDVIAQIPVSGGQALLNDPNVTIIREKSTAHEQVHMRCDMAPFQDKRVRQALALSLNRKKLVDGLFRGFAVIGNDSPFASAFPSTDPGVPQREQDIRKAKELLEAAGAGKGFSVTLTTERYIEIPDYAVLIQNFGKQIGIDIKLNVESQDAYYGKAVFGSSDWLDSPLGITDYGHRGVPNVFLSAPLLTDGTWNAAHFHNKDYDALVGQYVKALDLAGQRAVAGKIQTLLLDESPVLFSYFYDYLVATKKNVAGLLPIANRLFLQEATVA